MSTIPRIVEIRRGILKKNDELARKLRQRFQEANALVINLVSSPGSGKTALLERTLELLHPMYKVATLVGDLATENDAQRLARSGAPVCQISTGTTCHLEAQMIESALADWNPNELDILFIENVGNLVCPASYDLGENLRVVLFSVTEGEDKPLKYPTIFNSADVAVLTKVDLVGVVAFNRAQAIRNIHKVRPGLPIVETTVHKPDGLTAWIQFIQTQLQQVPHIV